MFAGRKLLVADDSPYYQTVIRLTFSDEGMEVTTAGDGREALEKLEQSTPDVILAHVAMPGINGYELCELIKQSERFGHIPVMLLVGLHEPFDQAEARRVGADDIVAKPFKSIRQLVGRVGSLLGGKAAETEDTVHEYSTLGLERSEAVAVPPAAPDERTMTETNVKVFVEAPAMTEQEPIEPEVEAAGSTCATDLELQTANTQKLENPDVAQPPASDNSIMTETNVKVFVEAPAMTQPEPIEPAVEAAGTTCVADAELQTSDTQKLERIDDEPASETEEPISYAQDDTIEMEPAMQTDEKLESPEDVGSDENISSTGAPEINETLGPEKAPLQNEAVFNEALLELGNFDSPTQVPVAEDLVLDLDYEESVSSSTATVAEVVPEPISAGEAAAEAVAIEPTHEEPPVTGFQEWTIVAGTPVEPSPSVSAPEDQESTDPKPSLSPEVIDAIARRAVELMSDKVVREIAWEVVPELAELLIRKKLDEQSK